MPRCLIPTALYFWHRQTRLGAITEHLELLRASTHPLTRNPLLPPQVQEVLAGVGKAANLEVLTVYGGTPYEGQERVLRNVRGGGGNGLNFMTGLVLRF